MKGKTDEEKDKAARDAALFESDVVRAEYEKLSRDHAALITMGEGFGSFDPLGKCAYVDAVEAKMEAYTVQDEIDALELDVAEEKRERSWREGRVSVSRETETMDVFTSFAEQHLRPMLAK